VSLVRKSSMKEKTIAANQENRSPSLGPLSVEGKDHSRTTPACHARRGTWPSHRPGSSVDPPDPRAANGFCRCGAANGPIREECGVLSMISGGSKGKGSRKKMLKRAVRSRNVYENIRNSDIMTDGKSDIFGDMTRFLQNIAACGAQLGAIGHRSEYRQSSKLVAANGQRPGEGERYCRLRIYGIPRY